MVRQLKCRFPGIAYGLGRSYGDVCLNPAGVLWKTTGLDRFISFDVTTGRLMCEAGVLLRDIQRLVIPHGWILPVTPGTQLLTVGGAIANDIHGKNHHVLGSFADHVKRISLVRTDGRSFDCGPDLLPEWFSATVGGVGLTGVITEAEIQLRPVLGPWLYSETLPYADLEEFFCLADDSEADWEHTVSWVDCVSGKKARGIFMRANPIGHIDRETPEGINLTIPFVPPISIVNSLSVRAFNSVYFNLNKWRAGRSIVHYERFFYPLDRLLEWNRIYGPKGLFQHQCVVPREAGREAIQAILSEISRFRAGSFLAVLKTFGNRKSLGMMSFPRPGVTLAVDFPNEGVGTLKLLRSLDAIVREAQGRIYLAKDASMPRDLFEAGYPRFAELMQYRDPGISSALSRRLIGN